MYPESSKEGIPTRFDWKWLLGPLFIILVAVAFVYLASFLDAEKESALPSLPEQPSVFAPVVDVKKARELSRNQCESTFDCSQVDCLEKILTHIDSSTKTIEAILRTPAPRAMRDHLRSAIRRGVDVRLVLDNKLNPKFFLEGGQIRVKPATGFVATNFMIIDRELVVFGTDPLVYAASPDIIRVACQKDEQQPYLDLFDRFWQQESTAFTPQTEQEEILSENEIIQNTNQSCDATTCGPDPFTCEGTTKILKDYFCADACVYQILILAYSPDCGYSNPGFGPDGNSLIVISEAEVDEGQLGYEFIEFLSLQSLELTGFQLLKDGQPVLTFSSTFVLNGAARVYSGSGTNSPTIVYLNQSSAIWLPGTTATLANPVGNVVASRTFEG